LFGKSHNYCSTGDLTQELNIHTEDLISTQIVRRDKSNIRGRAAFDEPLISESNAPIRKRWCHEHKTWASDNWKRARDMVR
jgi:hypothetical protein